MPDPWDSARSSLSGIIETLRSILEPLSGYVPLDVVLVVAVVATAMVAWWLARKLIKLALYAAIVGGVAWLWYLGA